MGIVLCAYCCWVGGLVYYWSTSVFAYAEWEVVSEDVDLWLAGVFAKAIVMYVFESNFMLFHCRFCKAGLFRPIIVCSCIKSNFKSPHKLLGRCLAAGQCQSSATCSSKLFLSCFLQNVFAFYKKNSTSTLLQGFQTSV